MRPARLVLPLVSALALAGCTADTPQPLAPRGISRNLQTASAGRFAVLATSSGFGKDFADRVAALGGTIEDVHSGAGFAVVSGLSSDAAAQLASASGVSEVQADAEVSLDAPLAVANADVSSVADASITSAANPAKAALFAYQWNMRAIKADAAWAAGKLGSPKVTVAILDSGLDYDNPDLKANVDLKRSVSFVPSDDTIPSFAVLGTREKVTDYNGHGTNVAAQVSSRAAAFAGVSSMTTLIGVKVIGASGSGSVIGILRGVLWAADHGADVANMSLGGDFAKAGSGRYLGIVNRIFNYANKQGMLIVVAAGNDAADLDHNANVHMDYCDQPQVICVAATGPELATSNPDNSSFFTNFGRSAISVAAPGGNADIAHYDPKTGFPLSKWPWGLDFASWIWSYCSKTTLATDVKGKLIEPYALAGCQKGNRATLEVGTSQASPHVAGLAALLVAEMGPGRPQQIKRAIEQSADDLGQPGTDPYYGRGRINVARALGIQ